MKRLLFSALLCLAACDEGSSAVKEPAPSPTGTSNHDAGGPAADGGAGADGGPKDCFDNPKTHYEIINACTSATKLVKNPLLPKLLPDGGLPPLN